MTPFRTFFEALVIGILGLLTGLAVNHRLVLDAFAGRLATPVLAAATVQSRLPQPVLLAEVRELLAAGALPVDARDAADLAGRDREADARERDAAARGLGRHVAQ